MYFTFFKFGFVSWKLKFWVQYVELNVTFVSFCCENVCNKIKEMRRCLDDGWVYFMSDVAAECMFTWNLTSWFLCCSTISRRNVDPVVSMVITSCSPLQRVGTDRTIANFPNAALETLAMYWTPSRTTRKETASQVATFCFNLQLWIQKYQ